MIRGVTECLHKKHRKHPDKDVRSCTDTSSARGLKMNSLAPY